MVQGHHTHMVMVVIQIWFVYSYDFVIQCEWLMGPFLLYFSEVPVFVQSASIANQEIPAQLMKQ